MDSDSDYDDVGVLPAEKDNRPSKDNFVRKPPKSNTSGKQVRGGDRQWEVLRTFTDSDEFVASDLLVKIKAEFVKVRDRQFSYALVQEYKCRYAKKSGYLPCKWVLRVIISSTDMSVKVETDHSAEHLHEPDPLFGQQQQEVGKVVMYRWTPKMTEIICQSVSNKGKPQVALRNMREAGCFDHFHQEPTMEQMYNKVADTKRALNPGPKISTTHDMRQFITNHIEVPEDELEGYIPFYDIQDEDPKKLRFTVIFASKRSISR